MCVRKNAFYKEKNQHLQQEKEIFIYNSGKTLNADRLYLQVGYENVTVSDNFHNTTPIPHISDVQNTNHAILKVLNYLEVVNQELVRWMYRIERGTTTNSAPVQSPHPRGDSNFNLPTEGPRPLRDSSPIAHHRAFIQNHMFS